MDGPSLRIFACASRPLCYCHKHPAAVLPLIKPRTLVTKRLYFGFDAVRVRDASGRVLARIVGLPPDRAKVSADDVCRDFGIDAADGQPLLDELVAEGLLRPRDAGDYHPTTRIAEYAYARVVEPLTRPRARQLVARACDIAGEINAQWTRNPLEIEAVAPHGAYLQREHYLDVLPLGIVVRNRPASRRARWRMQAKSDGAHDIRAAFKGLSSFVRAHLVTRIGELHQPYAVVFQADDAED
jgi:hypothetical protein